MTLSLTNFKESSPVAPRTVSWSRSEIWTDWSREGTEGRKCAQCVLCCGTEWNGEGGTLLACDSEEGSENDSEKGAGTLR